MSEREAFVRSICEQPEDDVVRLVFADWLDEHGEREYGAHVRKAIGYGNSHTSHNKSSPTHRYHPWPPTDLEWNVSDTMPDYCECATESRGLIYSVELNCEAFLKNTHDLFRRFPITKAWPRDIVIGEAPHLRRRMYCILFAPRSMDALATHAVFGEVYPRSADVRKALSNFLVAYGRNRVGLPPLPITAPAV